MVRRIRFALTNKRKKKKNKEKHTTKRIKGENMILDDLCRSAKRCSGIVLQVFVRDINASLSEIRKIGGESSTMYSHSITLHRFPLSRRSRSSKRAQWKATYRGYKRHCIQRVNKFKETEAPIGQHYKQLLWRTSTSHKYSLISRDSIIAHHRRNVEILVPLPCNPPLLAE